jgi:hypothetical protein
MDMVLARLGHETTHDARVVRNAPRTSAVLSCLGYGFVRQGKTPFKERTKRMSISAVAAATSHYVLMEMNRRIGPKVEPFPAGSPCEAIYGFSDSVFYEAFRMNNPRELTPYPLVKSYLRKEVDESAHVLKLVILDAAGPDESYVQAATIEAVLEAHENGAAHVTAAYRLKFNQKDEVYQVGESSAESEFSLLANQATTPSESGSVPAPDATRPPA